MLLYVRFDIFVGTIFREIVFVTLLFLEHADLTAGDNERASGVCGVCGVRGPDSASASCALRLTAEAK